MSAEPLPAVPRRWAEVAEAQDGVLGRRQALLGGLTEDRWQWRNAELDGAHHRLVGTWEDDVLRANDVVVAERHDRIVLLRLTAGNLRHDGPRVAGQLRAVLT